MVEVLVSGYGNSMYRDAVVFAILILILIIKPSGLLGKIPGRRCEDEKGTERDT